MQELEQKKLQRKIVYPRIEIVYPRIELPMHGLRLVRQIVYPELKADRKDWICRD